jgi:hypothetical protein
MLHEVVTTKDQRLTKPLNNSKQPGRNNGFVSITGDEKKGKNNEAVELTFDATFNDMGGFNFFIV